MNKALEQKLIGPMEESHTKEQSPQAVLWEVLWARRSKMEAKWARTHAWAGSLQGFRSIATTNIATTIFCCNKMLYYHKIPVCGNRIYILPQFRFIALSTRFVAIEAMYCQKLHRRCNMVVVLRQFHSVAWIGRLVAIKARYCNKVHLCGNI